MASCYGYCGLLTVLFLGRTICVPFQDDLCEILDDFYSSNGDNFSKISLECTKPSLDIPLGSYCKELNSVQENICEFAFKNGLNRGTEPKIFDTFHKALKGGKAICEDFKTLNKSLYNIYLGEPDFIGKQLSEDVMCHLFCLQGRQTECELLLRTYWIWKVLQEPKKGTQNPDDSFAEPKNEDQHLDDRIEPKKGSSVDSTEPKQGSGSTDSRKGNHVNSSADHKKGGQHPEDRNGAVNPEQQEKQNAEANPEQQGKQSAQNQHVPVAAVSNMRKATKPLDASGETIDKPMPAKPPQNITKPSQDNNNNNNNNNNVSASVVGHSGNPSPDKSIGHESSAAEHSAKTSPDKSNGPIASTDEHRHTDPTSKGTSAKPKDEQSVKDKDDNKLITGSIEGTEFTEGSTKPEVDKNPTKEITEDKQSTSIVVTKAGSDGNHGNNDDEISRDSEKISNVIPASTVREAEFGNPINEFDDGYEGQDNEYPEGGSTDEHESPSSDSKTSQSGSLDESKSDAKTPHGDTKVKEQARDPTLPGEEGGHFFAYFLAIVVLCIAGYLVFHNKQKIIALIVEGRHERRRRPNNGTYKRLDSKDSGKTASHVIF